MKKFLAGVTILFLFSVAALPTATHAWKIGDPLIPNACFEKQGGCGWNEIVLLGQNFITMAIYLASLAAVVSITYAGWLYITSGGNPGQVSKAHSIFGKVIVGIIFILGAWLIVYSILDWMEVDSSYSLLK